MPYQDSHDIVMQIRKDLLEARKTRNQLTSTTLQALLSAIDNAGAVPVSQNIAPAGVGSTEAARRLLFDDDITEIVASEIAELTLSIKTLGVDNSYVDELTRRKAVLEKYL